MNEGLKDKIAASHKKVFFSKASKWYKKLYNVIFYFLKPMLRLKFKFSFFNHNVWIKSQKFSKTFGIKNLKVNFLN